MANNKYLAFVLSEASRAELLKKFPPKFERTICHHVTIQFNNIHFDSVPEQPDCDVYVIGYAEDENIEALAVEIAGQTKRSDGSFFHVTHSLSAPKKPVDSNKLFDKIKPIEKIKITGEFRLEDK